MNSTRTRCAIMSVLCIFIFHGIIGSMELERISNTEGILLCLPFTSLWIYCTYRGRLFCWQNQRNRRFHVAKVERHRYKYPYRKGTTP